MFTGVASGIVNFNPVVKLVGTRTELSGQQDVLNAINSFTKNCGKAGLCLISSSALYSGAVAGSYDFNPLLPSASR
jgi:hypothetical protein